METTNALQIIITSSTTYEQTLKFMFLSPYSSLPEFPFNYMDKIFFQSVFAFI
jgi:hypothetical protein